VHAHTRTHTNFLMAIEDFSIKPKSSEEFTLWLCRRKEKGSLLKKTFSVLMLTLLLIGMLTFVCNIQKVKAQLLWKYQISSTYGTNCVSISGDGNYIVAGNRHGLFFFDKNLAGGGYLWKYAIDVDDDTPIAVSLSYDGSYIAAGSERAISPGDGYVYLFDREFTGNSYLWRYHITRGIGSVSISSDGKYIVAGSHDGYIYFFDKNFTGNSYLWRYFTGFCFDSVAISADGNYVVTGNDEGQLGAQGEVFLFDKNLTGGTYLWKYRIGGYVRTVDISKDGSYMVAGSGKDGYNVYFFDRNLTGGDCLWKYQVDRFALHVSVSAYGDYVAVGSYGTTPSSYGNVYLFDNNGTYLWSHSFSHYAFYALLSNDGGYLIAAIGNGDVYKFDKEGTLLWEYPTGGDGFSHAKQCAISDDGNYIAAGHTYFVFLLCSLLPPGPPYDLTIHSWPIGVTFTVNNVSATTPWSGTYDEGTSVILTMPEIHTVGDAKFYWDHWSDGVTNRSRTVIMNTNIALTAYFTEAEEGRIATGILGIDFVDENSGWAVGCAGIILHTTDGGANWKVQNWTHSGGIYAYLRDVKFVDSNNGWVVGSIYGNASILHTSDGGKHWEKQASFPEWESAQLDAVDFVNATHGWAVSSYNFDGANKEIILHTSDGGETWTYQLYGAWGYCFHDVTFIDENNGWVVGGEHNYHTTDGGLHWYLQTVPLPAAVMLYAVDFIDQNNGWAVSGFGDIIHTSDGGQNWIIQAQNLHCLTDVDFINSTFGWVVDTNGIVYHTQDGGTTWQLRTSGRDWRCLYVTTSSEPHVYVGGGTWQTAFGQINCLLAVIEKSHNLEWEVQLAPSMTFKVKVNETIYEVKMDADSTLTEFSFDVSTNSISFNVFGPSGFSGYCDVTIPKSLVGESISFSVYIDGVETSSTVTETSTNYVVHISYTPPPQPLSASISPLSASILVGQSVTFASTVSGGYPPYSYQWYLDGAPVSEANESSWTFTPTTSGIFYVYLKVTDTEGNTAQSETARITVSAVPVGGYSIPIQLPTTAKPVNAYFALLTILTAISIVKLRRRTKKH